MAGNTDQGGVLYLVATPIGNLEDISYRAVRVLGQVAVIAAEDTRTTKRLLDHYEISSTLISSHEHNEGQRCEALIARLHQGQDVAVVSDAGTPSVSDPGYRIVVAAIASGFRVESLPGPCAAITAISASGLATDRFEFCGFPPRQIGARRQLFGSLRQQKATLVFYEAPRRLHASLVDMGLAWGGARSAVVARELTKIHEEYVRGTLDELAAHFAATPARGECTIVVAGAANEPADEVDLEETVRDLLAQGAGPKEVAQRLVAVTGLPRRQIYQLALALVQRPRST